MPINREGDRWRVTVWRDGIRHRRDCRGTRREAQQAEAELRLELERSAPPPPGAVPTLLRFCGEVYLPAVELRHQPSWLRNKRYVMTTICQMHGDLPVDAIGSDELEAYARARLASETVRRRRRDEGRSVVMSAPSRVTVNNEIRVYRAVLADAHRRGLREPAPEWHPLDEGGEERVAVWTAEELAALLDATARVSPDLVGIVVCLANTGMRRGEALALRWDWVDLERGLLRIQPSSEWRPKSGRPREVPISDALLPWLQVPRRGDYVFPTRRGGRYSVWPARAFDRARDAAGLEGGVHTLRHTFASRFLAACPDLPLLASILGHSDTAVTRLYAHLLPDHLQRARNVVQVVATPAAAEALAMARWRLNRGGK